jgi:DNA-binding transcriptional MocR family regulator
MSAPFPRRCFPLCGSDFWWRRPAWSRRCQRIFSAALSGVPTWPQAMVADFIDEGHFATHIRTMRQHYKQRMKSSTPCPAARAALHIQRASAGFHTVGFFTEPGCNEEAFVRPPPNAGLTLSGIGRYCLEPINRKGVVIGYGAASEPEIRSWTCETLKLAGEPLLGEGLTSEASQIGMEKYLYWICVAVQ